MKRNNINDSYLDSLVKVIANSYVNKEGRRIEKEVEEINKEQETTSEEIKTFEKLYKKTKKDMNRRKRMTQVAATFLITILLCGVTFVSVPSVRATISKVFIEWKNTDEFMIKSTSDQNEPDRNSVNFTDVYAPLYIPDGFEILYSEIRETRVSSEYYGLNDESISFTQNVEDFYDELDISDSDIETVDIKNEMVNEEKIISKKDGSQITIYFKYHGYYISIVTMQVSKKETIKIANSVDMADELDANSKYILKCKKEFSPTYVPDKYRKTMEYRDSMDSKVYEYRSEGVSEENEDFWSFTQSPTELGGFQETEENAIIDRNVKVNEYDAILIKRTDSKAKILVWERDGYFIDVVSNRLSEEELLKIAESVK